MCRKLREVRSFIKKAILLSPPTNMIATVTLSTVSADAEDETLAVSGGAFEPSYYEAYARGENNASIQHDETRSIM